MTLRERIQTEITAAMRSGDALRRDTLRMAESALYNGEKRDRRTYSDDDVAGVLAREVKTRRESVEAFRKGGREELAAKEEAEIAILAAFLPEQLSETQITVLVTEAISATGAASPKDMGKVMGWLAPRTKGRADGRLVSQVVGKALAEVGAS
ncbi:MAG TPA: GatB/YqeY domain-containing protein [Candidatus Limnocylindria bacterium]|nr:GatB/YqeY domain-containing protein [Candidatus Limnocylindria bacterium]